MNVVWFKRDLRVYDNPALQQAMSAGPTLAIYCWSEWAWDKHLVSPAQRALILHHLKALEEKLQTLNVPLFVINTSTFERTAESIGAFVDSLAIQGVFFNKQYEENERNLEHVVSQQMAIRGVQCYAFDDQCVIAPGLITNKQGACFKVYSAFKRSYLENFYGLSRPISSLPEAQSLQQDKSEILSSCHSDVSFVDDISTLVEDCAFVIPVGENIPVGEEYAHQQLNEFVNEKALAYKSSRDFPYLDGTSGLSPYLAIGVLSTRQCIQVAMNKNNGTLDTANEGIETWINELVWRDFYRHLLFFYPKLSKHKAFKEETDALPWRKDESDFIRWCAGQTGYPIVDAAMRQLNQTGWMHNRLRMIVAMFLTKDLFIDWRWGEAYFMSKLIDGDLASNNGGWQWSASTGVDAAPYFRIFNPVRQSERFDPNGDFIRKYVPELAELDGKAIHWPRGKQRDLLGYPHPMVDHASATAQTKAWFKGETVSSDPVSPRSQSQFQPNELPL